jgi:hypothetical protein
VYASKSSDADALALRTSKPPVCPPIKIAESPRSKTETSDTEERVEDLRINLDPNPARRVDVITSGCAHRWGGIAEEQEEHTAPSDNVKTIDRDQEPWNS